MNCRKILSKTMHAFRRVHCVLVLSFLSGPLLNYLLGIVWLSFKVLFLFAMFFNNVTDD